MDEAQLLLGRLQASPNQLAKHGMNVKHDGVVRSALDLLSFPELNRDNLSRLWPEIKQIDHSIFSQIEIEAGYESYLHRQAADIDAFKRDEALLLPAGLNYQDIGGLSTEARSKLEQFSPTTLGAASRISGVTPAAISALLRHVKRQNNGLTGAAQTPE